MSKVYLVEDHDEVLKIWRRAGIRGLDLVHLDAHIDFKVFQAQSFEEIIGQAQSVNDLKDRLERSLSFKSYEKDLNKQTHIGNFIYAAMKEGMVRDFTWVVPGSVKDFQKDRATIRKLLKNTFRQDEKNVVAQGKGCLTTTWQGRHIRACCLETLPVFKGPVFLDIDTDYLVMKSLREDEPTKNINRRKPWIRPQELAKVLKDRVFSAPLVTISYSVNGGWTPMEYKYLGDDLAYQFAPKKFKGVFNRRLRAAGYFSRYIRDRRRHDYRRAVRLQPDYRAADNNYGPLYMMRGRDAKARAEFKKILDVDPRNPAALLGMGRFFLRKKEYAKAKKYLILSRRFSARQPLFRDCARQVLMELGIASRKLKDFDQAQKWLSRHRKFFPLDFQGHCLLGLIAEKEREFERAALLYKDAIRCGWDTLEGLRKLLKISVHCVKKSDIISFVKEKVCLIRQDEKKLKKGFRKRKERLIFEKKLSRVRKLLTANETKVVFPLSH
jgi:tetratricopeptide (TPR) repeat protein